MIESKRERDGERKRQRERESKRKEEKTKVSDDLNVSLVSLYNLLFSVKQFFCTVYTYINNYY